MENSKTRNRRKGIEIAIAAGASVVLTLLLFYFDEGNNNFEGLLNKQDLGGLFFYFLTIFGLAQLVINVLLKRLRKGQ